MKCKVDSLSKMPDVGFAAKLPHTLVRPKYADMTEAKFPFRLDVKVGATLK